MDKIDPSQLEKILRDELFSRIRYVGINGGEPTLHPDLAIIANTLVQSLPNLKGVSLITNAVDPNSVISQIIKTSKIMTNAGIPFTVSVSIDGIGESHDRNRGVKGNFISAVKVIDSLVKNEIPISIGCTLTPINCYYADDVLEWCEQNRIKNWEFRLAVPIKRIYNQHFFKKYQLSNEQKFHLAMFFSKLSLRADVDNYHKNFYRGLADHLSFNESRKIKCPWQYDGVTLDARGNLSFCSVQSPILNSGNDVSYWNTYKKNLPIRKNIRKQFCPNCMHDLLGPHSTKELIKNQLMATQVSTENQIAKLKDIGKKIFYASPKPLKKNLAKHTSPDEWSHVLITGWYGTETAGDKAILGELLHFIKKHAPNCKITITTLNESVSNQTKIEMNELDGVNFIDIKEGCRTDLIKTVDAVIVGGGPLEEINETEYIWRMFAEANRHKKARIIFGCGVGPLYSNKLRDMVGKIFQLTTAGFLRDQDSRELAIKLGGDATLGYACDPALSFVNRWKTNSTAINTKNNSLRVLGLVRANTLEYISDMSADQLNIQNSKMAFTLAQMLENICNKRDASLSLLPMHSVWIGGDDRIFNREISRKFVDPQKIFVERRYLPLNQLMENISTFDVSTVMRYHGHIFCTALGIPFLSLDYTNRFGKVHNFINRIEYEQWSYNWRNFNPQIVSEKMDQLIDERKYWSAFLLKKSDSLINDLNKTYSETFNI